MVQMRWRSQGRRSLIVCRMPRRVRAPRSNACSPTRPCSARRRAGLLRARRVRSIAACRRGVLALDGARLMSLQTQLQNGADALALAGAAELDRLPDAETRARTAIERLLTNATLFGSAASRTIAVSKIEFYSRLPAGDASPMS